MGRSSGIAVAAAVVVVVSVLAAAGLLSFGPGTGGWLVFTVPAVGALSGALVGRRHPRAPHPERLRWIAGATGGLATAVVVLVLAGCVALFGGALTASTALLVLVGVVVWAVRARRDGRTTAPTAAPPAAPSPDGSAATTSAATTSAAMTSAAMTSAATTSPEDDVPLGALSIEQICLGWQRSYVELHRHPTGSVAWADCGRRRRHYLDELERRDPEGFARWLSAGARAASDPGRFIPTHPSG
jgi:hypothetical protein